MSDEAKLDDVLFRFHQEVNFPTPEIVKAWTEKHPEFASEIRAHAVEIADMDFWNGFEERSKAWDQTP